ncbi:hypothetical protein FsymDg_1304 [Candidatus Protofrankia datiscae]|uniref:Uncharacterized protein n=3 Tax=Frankiaceae TaxID=74712 RepID=F8B152_9ACTN|nr:hypothetical protein [Candidatus Protofrankia datiscae]AEH08788.1 hypothetical protein FsymDg_1304 [Candidatus Protofrankia datiscae]
MLGAFWDAVGGKLADRWATVTAPALVFWLAGLAAWTRHRGGLHTLSEQTDWLDRQSPAVQTAAILTVLLAVLASGILVARGATPVLRLLEGYWPAWAGPLRRRLAGWLAARAATDQPAWQAAYARVRPPNTPTVDELAAYTRLERRRRRRPAAPGYFLPTPIGNILRAAERRPLDKYGLDTIILWPALPETTRADLLAARASLDAAVTTAVWGLLFCAFTPLTWLALPVGLAVAVGSVTLVVPARAQTFGDLVEAAYDQHRVLLYTQLRWPPPADPATERAEGARLTAYLWRGSDDTHPTFTPPPG